MLIVDEPPELTSIIQAEPRPLSRTSSTLLATNVDHLFARARVRYSFPPTKKTSSGIATSLPKAFASPPEALASPPKFESDDVRSLEEWIPLAPKK